MQFEDFDLSTPDTGRHGGAAPGDEESAATAVRNVCVLTETLLTLTRKDHPEVGDRLSLETYLQLRHVVLAHQGTSRPMIDLALAKRGQSRRIAVSARCSASGAIAVSRSPKARWPIWSWFWRKSTKASGGMCPLGSPRSAPPAWRDGSP